MLIGLILTQYVKLVFPKAFRLPVMIITNLSDETLHANLTTNFCQCKACFLFSSSFFPKKRLANTQRVICGNQNSLEGKFQIRFDIQ